MNRISKVNTINIKDVAFSSNFIIGDSYEITPVAKALAVQREANIFYDFEGVFNQYDIFVQELPLPTIYENLQIERRNENPVIKVKHINILGVSNAGVVQIGTTKHIEGVARVKHIRQLLKSEHLD